MLRIDRGVQCNANSAADAHTAAVHAQSTADSAAAKAAENAAGIAQANTTIATNENAFQQYKAATDSHLATLDTTVAAKADSDSVYTKSYVDEHFANHLVGQAAAYKTDTNQYFEWNTPDKYNDVRFDASSPLTEPWAQLSQDRNEVVLTPGVYQINTELRLIYVASGGATYETSFRCEISDMTGSSPTILGRTDSYFVKEVSDSATLTGITQGATLSIVESVRALQHIRLRLHAPHMDPAHKIAAQIDHAAISFIKLADAPTARFGMRASRAAEENWSSGN